MDVVCGRIYDEYEEAGWWDRHKSQGEVPVVGNETGGGLGVAGRALKAATISAGFMPPAFLGLCLYIYSSFE